MRVIALKTLRAFWETPGHEDAEQPLRAWNAEAEAAAWKSPADVKAHFRSASVLKSGRVVFNIAGNKYRLVVKIEYGFGQVYVRFIGTHKAYDGIDANTV